MEIVGLLFAILIGFTLGLLGGGGSILTVPILVYVLKMDAKLAIALSLAIVGATSVIGIIRHHKQNNISYKSALTFAPTAMLGTFLGAKTAFYLSAQVQLLFFGVIMLAAAIFMLKNGNANISQTTEDQKVNLPLTFMVGIIVGIITGIVGIGGGFLIVPALVLLTGLDMKKAVGTSLLVISLNSFSGFYGYLGSITIPWSFLGKFIFFSGIGILIGTAIIQKVPQARLKKIFGQFLIIMAIFILIKNL